MNFITYLSSGWNFLFPPSPTVTQELQELKYTIFTEAALIILQNDYLQPSPQNWKVTVFTSQFKERFPGLLADRLKKVFSEAAYKPQSCREERNVLYEQIPEVILQVQFSKASERVELKFSHAHFVLSELAWVYCGWYALNWFSYHALLNPTCVYDEKQLNELFEFIEKPVELSMRDVSDCINGVGVGYLIQAGFSIDFASIQAEPIDFEEIPDMDVVEAIKTNTMPPYLTQLMDKVPERLPNYKLMIEEYKEKFDKIQNIEELAQYTKIKKFIDKKTKQMCEKIFDPLPSIFR